MATAEEERKNISAKELFNTLMDSEISNNPALQEVLNTLEVDRKKIASTYTVCYILFGIAALIIVVGLLIGAATVAIILSLIPIIVGSCNAFSDRW